jgi:copper homeostasis protein
VAESILEVIVCSITDAIEAAKGGADRLEVVRELDRRGLTPSLETVKAIKHAVDLPLRVMVRESDGFEVSGETEVLKLCRAAEEFAKVGIDGLVLGFLEDGEIDLELTSRVLAVAPEVKATFHHAFEDATDQSRAVNELKSIGQIDRILSSGGSGELTERTRRLSAYAHAAAPEIQIIAGGGIDAEAIASLKRTTDIREFHVGRAARRGFQVAGEVRADLVQTLVRAIRII